VASLTLAWLQADPVPTSAVVHIKVSLADAGQPPAPIARHALLVSDDPPTAAPRRVVTTPAGTADIRLRPGHYIVESDRPAILNGRSYRWTETETVVAGRDATLELTAANAAVGP